MHKLTLLKISLTICVTISLPMVLCNCIQEEDDLVSQDCTNGCSIIKGRITTDNGMKGLSGIRLTVLWENISFSGGGKVRTKAKTRTDSDGNYEFRFSIRNDELDDGGFVVEYAVDRSKYLVFGESSFPAPDLKKDTAITLNFLIPKKSFVQWKILNQGQIGPTDYFASTFDSYMGYDSRCCSGYVVTWSDGLPLEPRIEVAGNQPLFVTTSKNRNGIRTSKTDTLYIMAGATRIYTLISIIEVL